jgi:hypothetical protein
MTILQSNDETRTLPHLQQQADLVVLGGGLAGTAAAIAAARRGLKVLLVTNRPMLGGNSSSEIRVWVCGATAHGGQKYARETGIMGEWFVENQYRNEEGNPYYWDQVVLDSVRAEKNITLWLNTDVTKVEATGPAEKRRILSVTGWQQGSEHWITFTAPQFIDATGDGSLGYLAGAEFRRGREAASEWGEEWAPMAADSHQLGSTMLLYVKDLGRPVKFVPPSIAIDISKTPIAVHRNIKATNSGCHYWWIEYGGELDVVQQNEQVRDELWKVIYGIWDYIKNSGKFDADNLTLEWVGSLPGKREYRRMLGDYVFRQQDVMEQTDFEDRIGFGGWSIDLHAFAGVYHAGVPAKNLFSAGTYHIPYRILYSRNVENMLMAGRNVSATHVGFGTLRVMATCAVMGEAAGAGAAIAHLNGITPRQVSELKTAELQESMLEHDSSILGLPWTSSRDLARAGTVSASSAVQEIAVRLDDSAETRWLGGETLAVLFPVDPSFKGVKLYLDIKQTGDLVVTLHSTDGGQNYLPITEIGRTAVSITKTGPQWVELDLEWAPGQGRNAVLQLKDELGIGLPLTSQRMPYGVIAMETRVPRVVRVDNGPQANRWDAAPFRRKAFGLVVGGATEAYAAAKAIGGLQRPFDGPQMWSSSGVASDGEWLAVTWNKPVDIDHVDLIFNDDVDEDLINLHHHHTPFPVIPELARDYAVEVLANGAWTTVETVTGNRKRLRRHAVGSKGVSALRVRVTATNGGASADIVALRVFA